jgi:polyphenol oxidase
MWPPTAESGLLTAAWSAPHGVRALTTTRRFANLGLKSGEAADRVENSRMGLRAALGLERIVFLDQVHGTTVVDADDLSRPADAVYTERVGVACAVLSADCLPVLIAAADGHAVAAAHAGWRGLNHGVIEATVARFRTGTVLRAWLGPAISQAAFQVGDEVREAFLATDSNAAGAFAPDADGRWRADLYALARQRLAQAGVSDVEGVPDCTFANPDAFHSYRRDGAASGRQATLIWRT